MNSKLLGTINPNNKTVSTWANRPNRASKKAFKTMGRILSGTIYKYSELYLITNVCIKIIKKTLKKIKVTLLLLL